MKTRLCCCGVSWEREIAKELKNNKISSDIDVIVARTETRLKILFWVSQDGLEVELAKTDMISFLR